MPWFSYINIVKNGLSTIVINSLVKGITIYNNKIIVDFNDNDLNMARCIIEEKNQLEIENLKFQTKSKSKLTPEDVLNFLHSMIDLDNNT